MPVGGVVSVGEGVVGLGDGDVRPPPPPERFGCERDDDDPPPPPPVAGRSFGSRVARSRLSIGGEFTGAWSDGVGNFSSPPA